MRRIELIISGRVQGVFFRASALKKAEEIGINGYAQNLEDGNVKIVAEGHEENLEMMISWARKGPPKAEVRDVKVKWLEHPKEYKDFSIL